METDCQKRISEAYQNAKAEVETWHNDVVRQKLEVQAQYFEDEMDEAARRNEDELKLFLDYYENKIRPFKIFIKLSDAIDKPIKDIQRKISNKIKKTFGTNKGNNKVSQQNNKNK